jgi:hypothetical protein
MGTGRQVLFLDGNADRAERPQRADGKQVVHKAGYSQEGGEMSKDKYEFVLYWNDVMNDYRWKAVRNNIWYGDLFQLNGKWHFYSKSSCYQTTKTLRKVAKKLDELNGAAK